MWVAMVMTSPGGDETHGRQHALQTHTAHTNTITRPWPHSGRSCTRQYARYRDRMPTTSTQASLTNHSAAEAHLSLSEANRRATLKERNRLIKPELPPEFRTEAKPYQAHVQITPAAQLFFTSEAQCATHSQCIPEAVKRHAHGCTRKHTKFRRATDINSECKVLQREPSQRLGRSDCITESIL